MQSALFPLNLTKIILPRIGTDCKSFYNGEKIMESGKFRKKRKSFAQVSNYALMDKNLSLKAKGLYAIIEAYISIPDFTLYKDFLAKQSSDGDRSFDGGWKELKEKGYLKIYKTQSARGFNYEYELLDEPELEPTPTKRTPGECRCGDCTDGKSTAGEEISKINNQEKNTEINNTYINNSREDFKSTKENLIDEFYCKTSDVDFNEINNFSSKQERLDKFLKTLNDNELQVINNLDKANATSFYLAIMNLFDDPKIQNKEGYLRTVLKNPESFIDSFVHKLIHNEQHEIYDSSNNVEITPEEEEAFNRLRNAKTEELELF